jgi:hypothetical protein
MNNDAMEVKYERIERVGTPSILQVKFASRASAAGKAKLYVSQSVVDELVLKESSPRGRSPRRLSLYVVKE